MVWGETGPVSHPDGGSVSPKALATKVPGVPNGACLDAHVLAKGSCSCDVLYQNIRATTTPTNTVRAAAIRTFSDHKSSGARRDIVLERAVRQDREGIESSDVRCTDGTRREQPQWSVVIRRMVNGSVHKKRVLCGSFRSFLDTWEIWRACFQNHHSDPLAVPVAYVFCIVTTLQQAN